MLSCLRRPLLAPNALRFARPSLLRNAVRSEHTAVTVRGTPAPYAAKRTSYLNPTLILIGTVPIFAFALGVWQVKRLKWKINLIDELTENYTENLSYYRVKSSVFPNALPPWQLN